MCGILAILDDTLIEYQSLKGFLSLIDSRGPDYSSPLEGYSTKCGLNLKLKSSLLHLRGSEPKLQPASNESGDILLFNGQIYEFNRQELDQNLSDTQFLATRLEECKTHEDITGVFSMIDGPFAFVYWKNDLNTLYYGRDLFGRKSLCQLISEETPYPTIISSVSCKDIIKNDPRSEWNEVDCRGLHCLDMSDFPRCQSMLYTWKLDRIYPPTQKDLEIQHKFDEISRQLSIEPLAPLCLDKTRPAEFTLADENKAKECLKSKLWQAVYRRIKYNRDSCLDCRRQRNISSCNHSKIAVAFSGGLDSTVIAFILDKIVSKGQTIDLSSVAFKDQSPDRSSVAQAFRELRKLCPERNWRLILRDVTPEELKADRNNVIQHLILPCRTVVDDSIGCGCWYISRASGRSLDSSMTDDEFNRWFDKFVQFMPTTSIDENFHCDKILANYTSPATMFFAGMGIDEQLGGYSSHRSAWLKAGVEGACEEVAFQMRRISSRNLGRDDRACSHHGRDVKLPYLDYDLVSYLNSLPVGLKFDLDQTQDVGPKKIIRELARDLGLEETSRRVKRAMQFGTRIANLENPREKGDDICLRL